MAKRIKKEVFDKEKGHRGRHGGHLEHLLEPSASLQDTYR
jgi:hypothetical protein